MTLVNERERTLRQLMTPIPHAVGADSSVADALGRMRALGIRHLPVMHEGRVVGVLEEQALVAICDHGHADPRALAAADVLGDEGAVVVGPEMPLPALLESMIERRAECAAVVERGQLVGIVTAQDLMNLLADVLFTGAPRPSQPPRPSDVRTRILAEHAVLRTLYQRIEASARAVLEDERDSAGALHERCLELHRTLLCHIELENAVLAPALRDTDAFGPLRADQLLAEHERQRSVLTAILVPSEDRSDRDLAGDVLALVGELRIDMAYEEQTLLHPNLLRDDPIALDLEAG